LQGEDHTGVFSRLLNSLPTFEQQNLLYEVLKYLSKEHLSVTITSEDDSKWWQSDANVVSGAAGLINMTMAGENSLRAHLIAWLTRSSGAGVGERISIRRAAVAAISGDKSDIETVLEKSLQQFGEQLYIRHSPTLQQEGMTLLCILCT
jgi:telomere length regulation protein